jgi:leukotriene-A4 hydrolase
MSSLSFGSSGDRCSLANIDAFQQRHIHLNWTIDFAQKSIVGHIDLTLVVLQACDTIILDSRDIIVSSVTSSGQSLPHSFGQEHAALGVPLHITVQSLFLRAGDTVEIRVNYRTTARSPALQWLEPSQTAGGQHPYLFSQCQAIHCRSLAPLQDSPSVKATYSSTVTVPASMRALMSAVCSNLDGRTPSSGAQDTISFCFEQKIPVPSYLIAIVVGDLAFADIGPRSRVWSEPGQLQAAASEFAETERFLQLGEELLTPYVWGRYDLLLLPPSFPYGGMENPCLTFVTPTLLAGDRSLVGVVAHEIAHSWTGNLVTAATWEHFWLNEGFTVMIERKILGKMYGESRFSFEALEGRHSMKNSVDAYGCEHCFTQLVPSLDGIDPDDAFSSIPYEKGFNFLNFLQEAVGGAKYFDPWLKQWVTDQAYKSVTTNDFITHFTSFFKHADVGPQVDRAMFEAFDWGAWLLKPGMPDDDQMPILDKSEAAAAETLAAQLLDPSIPVDSDAMKSWFSGQICHMLDVLLTSKRMTRAHFLVVDTAYALSCHSNSEIRFRSLRLGLQCGAEEVLGSALKFVTSQGRMKYIRPLYRDMFKSTQSVIFNLRAYHSFDGVLQAQYC